ncbi:hypothetical protein F2S74_00735 [Pseudomonas syringae pv. actinidiae]|nr:hypothetical protein [Pseudomonas syringae pv. actinidifoliorum]NAT37780.1 hypothetical protein [Pseudomonas syringae pv. actinidifoliorum]NVL41796.1 hypothetical protein [Pseudomonas syringae pv. actinidiae]NVL46771.1 hypothetical protein [Pseudomonas syringae pv. actinidiae]
MPDSQINEALTSSKLEYESAIGLSQHVPQAKTISEMVLDAFQTAKESEEIRELRAAIRLAQDEHDDDKAYELMGQLKRLKDAEAAFEELATNKVSGKIVLVIDESLV